MGHYNLESTKSYLVTLDKRKKRAVGVIDKVLNITFINEKIKSFFNEKNIANDEKNYYND